MRDIKFEIVAKNMSGTILREVFSLEQLMDSSWEESFSVDIIAKRQYTGLKDKNGVEIYEGDVLLTSYNDHYDFAHYKVVWRETYGCWWCDCVALHHKEDGFKDISKGGYCTHGLNIDREFKVIGNIYQNPELVAPQRQDNETNVKESP